MVNGLIINGLKKWLNNGYMVKMVLANSGMING